jgi:hypothetical protein
MFASKWARLSSAGLGVLLLAVPATATDPNRLQLLAAEAADLAYGSSGTGGPPGWVWMLAIVGTLFSAFGGAYFGLRRFSISHVRTHEGWREITYRFRAKGPLRFGGDVIQRLGAVIADLEQLTPVIGSRRRSPTPAPEEAPRAPAAPSEPKPPVQFVRRTEPEPTSPSPPTNGGSAPKPRLRGRADRSANYERARRLLGEGHDPWTVRELTGLKLAELDLLGATIPVGTS